MSGVREEVNGHGMEILIGNLLRAGVLISACTVLLGAMIYLFNHGMERADYAVFRKGPAELCRIGGVVKNTFSGPWHGRGLIQLGLLLLIATPVARVGLAVVAFARRRDALYVAISAAVFLILIFSLLNK